jgi:hypothetical protein
VYNEDEYLNGAGSELAAGEWPAAAEPTPESADEWPMAVEPALESADEWLVEPEPAREWAMEVGATEKGPRDTPIGEHVYGGFVSPGCGDVRERRLRRMAGVAVLAGAVGAVGGVVAANSSRAHRGAGRRPGSLVADMRSSRVVRSPVLTGSRSAPSSPVVTRSAKATRSHVARVRRRYVVASAHLSAGGSDTHPPTDTHPPKHVRQGNVLAPQSAGVGVQRGGGIAIVVDDSVGSSAGASMAADSSSGGATAQAGTGDAEFGFER